jgi:hypothetical protein
MEGVDRNVFSATPILVFSPAPDYDRKTYHLTCMIDSFLGHSCSSVSGVILQCDRTFARIDLWTDDLTGVCPVISVDGWNLLARQCVKINHSSRIDNFLNIFEIEVGEEQQYSKCNTRAFI